jgi:NAD(P)-dependent dehydrogenase (short-subunit alcohol dehydrogenase family)
LQTYAEKEDRRDIMVIQDSVAVVTGGASGLGEACVRNLVQKDARVAIFDVQVEKGEALAKELGPNVIFATVDVTSEESVVAGLEKTLAVFGTVHVDINCAGSAPSQKVLSKKGPHPLDAFNRTIQLNLVGTFNLIRLVVEQMVRNNPNEAGEKGVIINTSSIAAFDGQIGQAGYSATKAAVVGMTLPIARECADYGIRVMTIAPGIFETPIFDNFSDAVRESLNKMVPFPARIGRPPEFAFLVQHIIENPYLNGEVIRLDGAVRMSAK